MHIFVAILPWYLSLNGYHVRKDNGKQQRVLLEFDYVTINIDGGHQTMREVDLRSDTVSHPSPEMRNAIAEAKIGDDVFGDDPSVNQLEEKSADLFGKEAAVFVSSGTMGNLISILSHAGRGDEIILGDKSHIFRAEAGGAAALGGISYHTVRNDCNGMLDPVDVEGAIRDSTDYHNPVTSMVALENTQNVCGGRVLSVDQTKSLADIAHRHHIPIHLDGARIFNASVKLETPVYELVKDFDSVSFCLSKGLSCPVGSVVCGSYEFVDQARRWRKMVGGGMRQAGFMAAAGIVALDTMIDRLADDHANALRMANGLSTMSGIKIDPVNVDTNLVFFDLSDGIDPLQLHRKIESHGVKGGGASHRWRFVTHYGITTEDVDYTLEVMNLALTDCVKS